MNAHRREATAETFRVDPANPDPELVRRVAGLLRRGAVAVFPTDTLYGLGCSGRSPRGLERLRELKGGDRSSPFILLLGEAAWVAAITTGSTSLAERLMARHWPGPLTIVLDAAPGLDETLVSEAGTVAVRVPRSELCTSLCRALGGPIASTSANAAGRPPAPSAIEAVREFGDRIDVVLDGGRAPSGIASTIVDARGDRPLVLRQGATRPDV